MNRPRDGAQLIVAAATRHSANGETATGEPFSQLISPRCCSWASSVQRLAQLPNMRCPDFDKYIVRQLNKGVSLLFSVEIRSPSVKYGYDNVFTLGPPRCVCDHSFDETQGQVSLRSNRVCHRNDHGTPGQPTKHVTEERHRIPCWL